MLQKPDFAAADGVSVTGVCGFQSPFYGTSAAAPHAAAIAALLKSAKPGITPEEVRAALLSGAIDIEAAGIDRDSGAGILMAPTVLINGCAVGSAALFMQGVQVSDNPGNGNGAAEAGEGARLTIPLMNHGLDAARGVSATLTSRTNGITITQPATGAYPDIAVSGMASNTTPMTFTIASDFPCPRPASFDLTLTYNGDPTPHVLTFDVAIGPPAFRITTILDTVPPPAAPGVHTSTGVQNSRLNRDFVTSACGTGKTFPRLAVDGVATNRQFDAYAFDTCAISAPTCVTVTLEGADSINLFAAAYAPTFDPADIAGRNYKADPGVSNNMPQSFSFDLPGGAQQFAIDVHDVPQGPPSGRVYTLSVSGACMGACNPPNRAPVARARNVVVASDATCGAAASVDDDSSDADGDTLTITQSPAGPYPPGTTSVLLTVVDPSGAASQATATVTVVDETPPAIACPAPITVSTLPGACSAPVDFTVTASDHCSPSVTVVSAPAPGSRFNLGRTTVTSTARDAAGNAISCPVEVTVVDNEKPSISNLSVDVSKPRKLHDDNDDCPRAMAGKRGKDGRGERNHGTSRNDKVVDVTLNYDLLDNCGASCVLSVHGPRGRRGPDQTPDWTIVDAQHVVLIVDDDVIRRNEIYMLELTCTDAAGNKEIKREAVVIPDHR